MKAATRQLGPIALAPIAKPMGANTSVNGRVDYPTDRVPIRGPMGTNTSVNGSAAKDIRARGVR